MQPLHSPSPRLCVVGAALSLLPCCCCPRRLPGAVPCFCRTHPPLELSFMSLSRPFVPWQPRYWTPEEHRLFMDAVQRYGWKDVKSIAQHVGTRTPTQVRTHAQKLFLRQQKEQTGARWQ